MLEVPGSIPARGEENWCPNTLSLVSFAGMTLDKCIVLRIGTLTGCPLCRESHPLCRLKNPTVISIWLLVGFHPATRSVQSTPADNTRKRVWQYIEKERNSDRYICKLVIQMKRLIMSRLIRIFTFCLVSLINVFFFFIPIIYKWSLSEFT